jgi:DNA-binding PadR family transcriptional regulator
LLLERREVDIHHKLESDTTVLTELEGAVLGMIGLKGPCTTYAVRREFMDSPSQYWTASSGAVYPLVLRLKKRGLIHARRKTGDRRGGALYVITALGSQALVAWLRGLGSPSSISVPPDPLRTRISFFGLLDPETQQTLLARAVNELKSHLAQVRAHSQRENAHHRTIEHLVSAGAEQILESRLEWLLNVVRVLKAANQ